MKHTLSDPTNNAFKYATVPITSPTILHNAAAVFSMVSADEFFA